MNIINSININYIALFFIIGFVYFFSVLGYGILFRKFFIKFSDNLFSITFFFGIIFLSFLQFIIYVLYEINSFTNLIIIILGIIPVILKYPKFQKQYKIYSFFYLILFSLLIAVKPHDDFFHHLGSAINYFETPFTFGLNNISQTLGYHPITVFLQTLSFLPIVEEKLFYLFNYTIYVAFILFLFEICKSHKLPSDIKFVASLLCIFFLLKFDRISEHGNDLPGQIFLLLAFILFVINLKNMSNLNNFTLIIFFFIFSTAIKTTNIFFAPLLIFGFYKNLQLNNFMIKKFIKFFIICLISTIIIFIYNFIKTGCLIPLASISCADSDMIPWADNIDRIKQFLVYAELDTKGYTFDGVKSLFNNEYLELKNWVPVWIKLHFFNKVTDFISLFIFLSIITLFFFRDNKFRYTLNISFNYCVIFLCSLFTLILWFFYFPQVRYFSGGVLVFLTSIYLFLLHDNIKFNLKKFNIFLLIVIFVFNVSNINRIKNEHYQYSNFNIDIPFIHFPIKKIKVLNEYKLVCRLDIECEFKKNLTLYEYKYYNIIY